MNIRWYQELNWVTAADVIAARERGVTLPLMGIKALLQDRTPMRLQYYKNDVEGWLDVPTVIKYRNE